MWLHRFAEDRTRTEIRRLRVEMRNLRRTVRDLRDAHHTLAYVASMRSAHVGRLQHELAALQQQGESK